MKATIHIDIGQYEFVEFETEDYEATESSIKDLEEVYKRFHKLGDKLLAEEARKNIKVDPRVTIHSESEEIHER